MLERPRWKAGLHVELVSEASILIVDERDYKHLTGRAYALLAPLLLGEHTQEELFDLLGDKIFFPEISYAIDLAEAAGLLVEGSRGDPRQAAYWNEVGADMGRVEARLAEACVVVDSVGDIDQTGMIAALGAARISTGNTGNFHLVLCDDYMRPEIAAINRRALASGRPWMLARPIGQWIWIGPVFRPGRTACWNCLTQRVRLNRQLELFLERSRKETQLPAPIRPTPASIPATLSASFHLIAAEVGKALVLDPGGKALEDVVVTLESATLTTERHRVMRRPQCVDCGDASYLRREPSPLVLQSRQKARHNDGGHRTLRPELTYERLKHHVDSITGVVRNLEQQGTGINDGLTYSYSAGHNFAQMHENLEFVLHNLRGRSGGKGMSDIQAKVSAIGESIERYSAVYRGESIERLASYEEMGSDAIHPYKLMLFSETQYLNREQWNSTLLSGFHTVPEPFDTRQRMNWCPVFSLTNGGFRWVPSVYCYFGHPDFQRWRCCTSDSNGNAAGNTLEEAILQGFLELVERDAVALWWYNRLRRPALDLDSFKDPYLDELRQYYRGQNRDLWVLDITSDLGVPTFAAVCPRMDHSVQDIVVGFGSHFNPRIALIRTLTEVNQFMPAVTGRDTKGNTIYYYAEKEALHWWKTATLESEHYLPPAEGVTPRRAADFFDRSTNDLATDVLQCVDIARKIDSELLVIDHTQPDIGFPSVKVIVPGLRHFWRRLGPGRLYDVPVKMGWAEKATPEGNLNPRGVFF